MPFFTQTFAILIAGAYIMCAATTDRLANILLVLRTVLPDNTFGYKFSGRALDSLPEIPAPVLIRVAFVAEQACLLWLTAILLLMLALPPILASLSPGTPTLPARTSYEPHDSNEGTEANEGSNSDQGVDTGNVNEDVPTNVSSSDDNSDCCYDPDGNYDGNGLGT